MIWYHNFQTMIIILYQNENGLYTTYIDIYKNHFDLLHTHANLYGSVRSSVASAAAPHQTWLSTKWAIKSSSVLRISKLGFVFIFCKNQTEATRFCYYDLLIKNSNLIFYFLLYYFLINTLILMNTSFVMKLQTI